MAVPSTHVLWCVICPCFEGRTCNVPLTQQNSVDAERVLSMSKLVLVLIQAGQPAVKS